MSELMNTTYIEVGIAKKNWYAKLMPEFVKMFIFTYSGRWAS